MQNIRNNLLLLRLAPELGWPAKGQLQDFLRRRRSLALRSGLPLRPGIFPPLLARHSFIFRLVRTGHSTLGRLLHLRESFCDFGKLVMNIGGINFRRNGCWLRSRGGDLSLLLRLVCPCRTGRSRSTHCVGPPVGCPGIWFPGRPPTDTRGAGRSCVGSPKWHSSASCGVLLNCTSRNIARHARHCSWGPLGRYGTRRTPYRAPPSTAGGWLYRSHCSWNCPCTTPTTSICTNHPFLYGGAAFLFIGRKSLGRCQKTR